jgi:tRNA (guanine6-N2)-methyltransferase
MPTAVRLVARCVRGIEWLCAAELARFEGASVERVEHRLVEWRAPAGPDLLTAGTIDDLFLLAARLTSAGRHRAALDGLREQAAAIVAGPLLEAVRELRPLTADAAFEVVGSFLGPRNYNRFEVERAVGEGLAAALGRRFVPGPIEADGHPPLSWRVHLFDGGGFLGLRLAAGPLHRRPYRASSVEGAIHPPLAHAAAMLAGPERGDLVLDPCCGAGTMLLEAARLQPAARLVGADVAIAAVQTTRANAARAGARVGLLVADAGRLAASDGAAGVVLTNPPWRRRLAPAASLAAGLAPFWPEAARVTGPGGRVVAALEELEDHLPAIAAAGLEPVVLQRVAVSGAWTTLALLAPAGRRAAELERLATRGTHPPAEALANAGAPC